MSLEDFMKHENYFNPHSINELSKYGSFISYNVLKNGSLSLTFSYDFKKMIMTNKSPTAFIAYPTSEFLFNYNSGKINSITSRLYANGSKTSLDLDKVIISADESVFLNKLKKFALTNRLLLSNSVPISKKRNTRISRNIIIN